MFWYRPNCESERLRNHIGGAQEKSSMTEKYAGVCPPANYAAVMGPA